MTYPDIVDRLRLNGSSRNCEAANEIERLRARIAELEADLKQHQSLNAAEHEILLQVTAERDAIKAKTIEDACAAVASVLPVGGLLSGCQRLIRALNQEADGKQ